MRFCGEITCKTGRRNFASGMKGLGGNPQAQGLTGASGVSGASLVDVISIENRSFQAEIVDFFKHALSAPGWREVYGNQHVRGRSAAGLMHGLVFPFRESDGWVQATCIRVLLDVVGPGVARVRQFYRP